VSGAGGSSAGREGVVDRTARAGLFAKGALYAVLGVLAARLAGGDLASDASQQGAMRSVAAQPFGRLLLTILALGLAGYALWRLRQAITPPDSSLPRWLLRTAMVVRAIIYAGFAFLAAAEVVGAATGSDQEESTTAALLGLPGGVALVVAVGLVVLVVGLVQFREAWTCSFRDHLDLSSLTARSRRLVEWVGRAGHAARGAVFCTSGGFLVRAAVRAEPEEGVGLDAALHEVLEAPAGPWALAAIATGLVLYGGFCILQARFARTERVE
jgi:uncharacterized membrane protein